MTADTACVVLWRRERSLITLEELASEAGVHPELAASFVSYGLLAPEEESAGRVLFARGAVERLRSIVRLRRDLGVNLAGIAVILEMRDRLEALREQVERLRQRLEGGK